MPHPVYAVNWFAGWSMVLGAFLTGAGIGLFFHRDVFLGGYDSFRRRLLRLGHIALAALGLSNVLYSLAAPLAHGYGIATAASASWIGGGILMPAVCFLTAWRPQFRHLFALPVTLLLAAVLATLVGGLEGGV